MSNYLSYLFRPNQKQTLCSVSGCDSKWHHVTSGHLCKICLRYGHGKLECGDTHKITYLFILSKGHIMPYDMQCQINGCQSRKSHCTLSHHCQNCTENHKLDDSSSCQWLKQKLIIDMEIICITDNLKRKVLSMMGNTKDSIVVKMPAGLCSYYYIRRDNLNSELIGVIFHDDNFGKYGPEDNDELRLNNFISGYKMIEFDKF